MFVPRQFQKPHTASRHHHPSKSKPSTKPAADTTTTNTATKPVIDIGTARAIVLVLEQLFSSENPHAEWFQQRMREVDGHNDYVHLAALVECPYLSDHKPTLSQIVIRRALEAAPSEILQTSSDGYHLRLSSSVKRTALLESHTVYIEPSIGNATRTPGRLALELQKTLPPSLLPVRYTQNSARSWALLTLSSPVTEEHTRDAALWPSGWVVLTQAEWERRDAQYRQRRQAAMASRHHEQLHNPVVEEREEIVAPKHAFEPGLIVHISNLHPEVNKPGISSFLMRCVDRYLRKLRKKKKEAEAEEAEEKATHKVQINYIDYKKGADSCYIRQATRADSELIVTALKKRRRAMQKGNDRRGRKVKEGFVVGRILEGEEEKVYWSTVQASDKAKKGGKKGKGKAVADAQKEPPTTPARTTVDVREGRKRPRLSSSVSPEEVKRRKP